MAALAGANIIYGAGMLDMGMGFSFPQLLLDHDLIRMIRRAVRGVQVTDETIALEVIERTGVGGHYLADPHTLKYMRREQVQPELLTRMNRDQWEARGGRDIRQEALEKAKDLYDNHTPDPLPDGLAEEFDKLLKSLE